MATLIFFDKGHKYTLDGEELPSVSELCRFLSREVYGEISQYTLDHAAERGTKVHKACQALDTYGKVEVTDDILPYVKAYLKFLHEHSVNWSKVEFSLHHPVDRYAGTIDRYGELDGFNSLVDIKTTYIVHRPLCIASLNLYSRMLEYEKLEVQKRYILHLKKDGSYKLVEFEKNDSVPDSLLALHNLLKKKRRKKNG